MAQSIEKTANEYAEKGWRLLSFSITASASAILIFETDSEK